jgi:hypothetical protein
MKTEHTPGPWTVTFGIDGAAIHNGVTIAKVNIDAIAWKTNARLMAAAPELLAALERIETALEHDPEIYADLLSITRAAITKANGGAR